MSDYNRPFTRKELLYKENKEGKYHAKARNFSKDFVNIGPDDKLENSEYLGMDDLDEIRRKHLRHQIDK
jgi:hypothetical protein